MLTNTYLIKSTDDDEPTDEEPEEILEEWGEHARRMFRSDGSGSE